MNKQYVERVQNGKKAYPTSVGNIPIWFYCSLPEIRGKQRSRMAFWIVKWHSTRSLQYMQNTQGR